MPQTAMGQGLLIGIPTLGRPIHLNWAQSYRGLFPPINFNAVTAIIKGKPVDIARNEIAAHAINHGFKYLFFLGDDTEVPPDGLKQLIFHMEHQPELGVVGGIYCSKSTPAAPLVFRGNGNGSYWDWKVGEYFSVTGLGMDATLIRVDMLKQLQEKITEKDVQGNTAFFKTIAKDGFADGIDHVEQWTEDLYFCDLVAKETDFQIFADGSLLCPHWDAVNDVAYGLPAGSFPLTRAKEFQDNHKKDKVAVDIGAGLNPARFEDYDVFTIDIRDECSPDLRCDIRQIPLADESFDRVYSSHVLEHFDRNEVEVVFTEWVRLVKKGGDLILVLPNIEWAMEQYKEIGIDALQDFNVLNVLYGGQSNPWDHHRNPITEKFLLDLVKKAGFVKVDTKKEFYNIILTATKPEV